MPTQAQRLVAAAASLDETGRAQLRAHIFELGLPARMARRACQAAPSSLLGAVRIIDALEKVLGKEATIAVLREAEYDRRLMACAERFIQPKKNRLEAAAQLCEHLRDIFGGNPELDGLLDEVRQRSMEQGRALQPVLVTPCT